MAEWTMRLRNSSRCSIRLMPGKSTRLVTASRALPIASAGSTILIHVLLIHMLGGGDGWFRVAFRGYRDGSWAGIHLGGNLARRRRGVGRVRADLLANRRRLNARDVLLGHGFATAGTGSGVNSGPTSGV